jgi:hypothetical protein
MRGMVRRTTIRSAPIVRVSRSEDKKPRCPGGFGGFAIVPGVPPNDDPDDDDGGGTTPSAPAPPGGSS